MNETATPTIAELTETFSRIEPYVARVSNVKTEHLEAAVGLLETIEAERRLLNEYTDALENFVALDGETLVISNKL